MKRFGWKWGMTLFAVSATAIALGIAAGGFFDGNAAAIDTPVGWTWDD